MWLHRESFYAHIPVVSGLKYGHFVLDAVLLGLGLAGITVLVYWLRAAPWIRKRARETFQRARLRNGKGEYPLLISVLPDRTRAHGYIYKVRNRGIPLPDFDTAIESLKAGLNGHVGPIEYGRKNTITLLHFIPKRFAQPRLLTLDSKELCQEPNMLVVGKTGSGKNYFLLLLLGIYAKYIPGVRIIACMYKCSFVHFLDTPNFYSYKEIPNGIRAFYREFSERLAANDEERNQQVRVLLIDEYAALISAQEKKIADEIKAMVGEMLMMGRSLGMRVVIGVQRADAELFKTGSRDQFRSIFALGNLSKEHKSMLFTDYKEQMTERNGLGEGYLLVDGQDLERVKVGKISERDLATINDSIRQAMSR